MADYADFQPFVARVIYSFQATFDGELSLEAGDLVVVKEIRDQIWYYGQLSTSEGRFPRNNVTGAISLQQALPGQTYFATLADFEEQEIGDLSFKQGEILVGIQRFDDNWWYGRAPNGREGNFPTSYVWQIELSCTKNISKGSCLKRRRARVLQDLVAQLPEELNLRKGEEVIVTGEAEDGWYYGEHNGRSGTFPQGFVTFLADDQIVKPPPPALKSMCYSNLNNQLNCNRPYGIVNYEFRASHSDELSLQLGQTIFLLKHVNDEWIEGVTSTGQRGIFPTSYIQIVIDCDKPAEPRSNRSSSQDFDLLLDFDPLLSSDSNPTLNQSVQPISKLNLECKAANSPCTTGSTISHEKDVNLDSFIVRNLNQLESSTREKPHSKSRPSSWSQELTNFRRQHLIDSHTNETQKNERDESNVLPKIPPRRHEIFLPSHQQKVEPNLTEVAHKKNSLTDKQNEDGNVNRNESFGEVHSPSEKLNETSTENHDSGAPRRRSYIRPAPPPPTQQIVSAKFNLDRQCSTSSNENCRRPHRPAPSIPPVAGDDTVEGRRKRAENERLRKMEEDKLRDIEIRKKILEQRQNVITELLVTEREYCRDLRLTSQVFQLYEPKYLEEKGIDVNTLFGNMIEIINLSESFIDQLNECTKDDASSEENSIGNCFIRNEPEFRRLYGEYCINHDIAQNLLEKYESVPSINQILVEGVLELREQVICFNMGSVIIKPVQRIMKYPLILNELIKSTENNHPDKNRLMLASSLMAAVATHINESKRKKEIVLKYRDTGLDGTLSKKISRLSMHSVAKKSSRLGMLLKTTLGIAPSTRDEAFDDTETRFNEMVRIVHTVLRDINVVCEQLKASSKCQFDISEAVASFYGEGCRLPLIDNFRTAQRIIYQQHWSSFDSYVIRHVRNPLTELCEACVGPIRLVGKRRDKLLDANIASDKVARNKDPTLRRILEEEENIARNTYVALNSQLMEELPVVTEHGFNIYRRCLSSFLYARKLLIGRITKALLDLNVISDISNLKGEIEIDFNIAHVKAVDRLNRISFISKSFRANSKPLGDGAVSPCEFTPPRLNAVSSSLSPMSEGLVVQSREMVNLLRTKYHPDQLYMVSSRCDIKEPLDLAANSGLIVCVIKREDPMGNSGRWFVDAGEVRGFLPAKNLSLIPQHPSGTSRLLRPDSAASVISSGLSATSGTSDSFESLQDIQKILEPEQRSVTENYYDQPPSYEEALGTEGSLSPHRYCEIDDIIDSSNVEQASVASPLPEKAESPIYADIDEIYASGGEKECDRLTSNNVYKVDYSFKKRTNLEISLVEDELVTVLVQHDEAGNSEWWLVENDAGVQGYAPAAYLSQLVPETSM